MTTPSPRSGFTLIELMIAIALGSLLVYTAIAAFRVASQTVTITNRMSLENSLIRAGMFEAHNQLDFWTNLDDPDDSTKQRLRAVGITGNTSAYINAMRRDGLPATPGLAFAPMKDVFPPNKLPRSPASPSSRSQTPRFPTALNPQVLTTAQIESETGASGDWEGDTGFDPSYVWAPHDPRTWYRGNTTEKHAASGLRFGRYGIFTNIDENPLYRNIAYTEPILPPPVQPPPPLPQLPTTVTTTVTYSATPRHLWYGRQLIGLSGALGLYGLCEYTPPNMIYSTYASRISPSSSQGGIPEVFSTNSGFWDNRTRSMPQGIYHITNNFSCGITTPANRAVTNTGLSTETYTGYQSDYGSGAALQNFIDITITPTPLMQQKPDHWSTVTVGVGHVVKSAKFVNIAKVRWLSPITGEMSELSFTGVGSTLRGARMQRKPGGGWATWDNAPTVTNDANLDTP